MTPCNPSVREYGEVEMATSLVPGYVTDPVSRKVQRSRTRHPCLLASTYTGACSCMYIHMWTYAVHTHIHRFHTGTKFLLKWWGLRAVFGMSLTSCVWTWTSVKNTQIEPVCSFCLKKKMVAVSRMWIKLYVIKDFILQLRKVKKI